jgi:hypothetical protein
VTAPATAAIATPSHPDRSPRTLPTVSGSRYASDRLMRRNTPRSWGSMFSKAFHAFTRAARVFFLSLKKDNARKKPATA